MFLAAQSLRWQAFMTSSCTELSGSKFYNFKRHIAFSSKLSRLLATKNFRQQVFMFLSNTQIYLASFHDFQKQRAFGSSSKLATPGQPHSKQYTRVRLCIFRRETVVKLIPVSTGSSFVYIITSKVRIKSRIVDVLVNSMLTFD